MRLNINALTAEQREAADNDGQAMYLAGPDDPPIYASGENPDVACAVAFAVHLIEDAKRTHVHVEDDSSLGRVRDGDAADARACAEIFEQAAAELRRVADLLDGPRPELDA